jgi:anti-anti-sigma factor
MMLADLSFESRDGIVVARIDGEIDLSNAGQIGAAVALQVTNQTLGVAIDFSGLRYIDSAGIQVLYNLRKRLKERGQGLRLVVPSTSIIRRTLDLVDVPRTIGILETTEAAVADLASGSTRA